MKYACTMIAAGIAALGVSPLAHALSVEEANKSNNPLNPAPGFNLQDYYAPNLYGLGDDYTNDFLLRGTLPLPPMGFVGVPQLVRVTAPISTRPDPDGGSSTGLGDINLFDIFLMKSASLGMELGVGPLLTMPTASKDELGTGKWQGGLAAVAIKPSQRGLLGGLLQWQASFAGDSDRQDTSTLTAQPFVIHNLKEGWYLKSTAIWTFDLKNDKYYIPLGLGAGKAWKPGSTTFNASIEPQWTVAHDGDGVPQFQVFGALNMTFGT